LKLTKKKKSRSQKDEAVQAAFASHDDDDDEATKEQVIKRKEPLVIPAGENKLRIKVKKAVSVEDAEAAKALEQQATGTTEGVSSKDLTIQANRDTFQQETQQYKTDLEELPDEAPLKQYQRVPIGDFGAALLRGMGWNGDNNNNKSNDDDDTTMPRPHRLGLGATPKVLDMSSSSSSKRPDQMKRQQALKEQQEEYQREREKQIALDKQRTLQNGSLVQCHNGQRCRILQLVGVPGLNMVKVQYENELETSIIKRGEIESLLSRQELTERPFCEAEPIKEGDKQKRKEERRHEMDRDESRREKSRNDKRKSRDESNTRRSKYDDRPSKRSRDDSSSSKPQWVIPNIRVRVITEKLGRRHFKEKGIVVDVTPKGATIEMENGHVLDRVAERYLETALPKPGGKAVVLAGEHRFAKGQLLERDSRKARGVIQVYEDMNVLTLPLDDLAEWCGPLDEDLG